ncbi:hypothetical protein SAMN04487825_12151 [Prevotella sp. kh1p2]|nr:hypothetical protein SAMN04487825_12151 [Prevotella sp. kh1p2]SNU12295.1 hypothetical protein SAMN06298210_12213 [Prevotellaceae bacterium KH2P17]
MAQLGKSSHQSLAEVGGTVVGLLTDLGVIGKKAGGIVSAIIELLDVIQKQGFAKFVGNVLGNVAGAVGSVFHDIGSVFGLDLFGMGSERRRQQNYQNTVNKYEELKDIWQELIDKKKEYLNMSWGKEAAGTQVEIDRLYQSLIKGTRAEADALLNTKVKHHAASHGLGTWENTFWSNGGNYKKHAPSNPAFWQSLTNELRGQGYMTDYNGNQLNIIAVEDFFNLTKEELEYIKIHYAELWATQNSNVKKYLEAYIDNLSAAENATQDRIDAIVGSISDLTDTLGNLAKKSQSSLLDVKNSFADTFNAQIWKSLTEKGSDFYEQMERYQKGWQQAISDDTVTDDEKKSLYNAYLSAYQGVKGKYDALAMPVNDASSLTNMTTGITEDTANLIASYVNAIRADESVSLKYLRQYVEELYPMGNNLLAQQVALQKSIEANTRRNADAAQNIENILDAATKGTKKISIK